MVGRRVLAWERPRQVSGLVASQARETNGVESLGFSRTTQWQVVLVPGLTRWRVAGGTRWLVRCRRDGACTQSERNAASASGGGGLGAPDRWAVKCAVAGVDRACTWRYLGLRGRRTWSAVAEVDRVRREAMSLDSHLQTEWQIDARPRSHPVASRRWHSLARTVHAGWCLHSE